MTLRPRPGVAAKPYSVPRAGAPVDLALDANEGAVPDLGWLDGLQVQDVRRYPSARSLEAGLAEDHGVSADQVVVTAGADDGLDRACRAVLGPNDEAIFPVPGFSVMSRWIGLTGAREINVPWPDGPYPTQAVLAEITPRTRMIVVTSPNNPTGGVATADDLRVLAEAAPQALVLVDLAYAEFADEDLTEPALALPNALITRTFSKAWGLAGLRLGYALGPAEIVGWLRCAGLPYPCSSLSLVMGCRARKDSAALSAFVAEVRRERPLLLRALARAGARPQQSQANFVLARVADSVWWRDAFAGMGIGIRAFPGVAGLDDAVRIAVPGEPDALARVEHALAVLSRPARVVLDARLDWAVPAGLPVERADPESVDLELGGPTWVVATTIAGVARARAARALPLGVGEPALVGAGAARILDAPDGLARLWPSEVS